MVASEHLSIPAASPPNVRRREVEIPHLRDVPGFAVCVTMQDVSVSPLGKATPHGQ